MRKKPLLQPLLAAMLLLLFSCRKDQQVESNQPSSNDQIISKVKLWLETEKSKLYANKTANVDVLKKYLDYSNLRIEDSDNGEQIVSIPITKKFNNDQNSIPSLVLLLNNAGNIRRGNVVLFKPKVNGAYTTIPDKVLPGIYSTSEVKVDGQFRFLNIAGHWVYQLDYENGRLNSSGLIKTKEDATGVGRTNSDCLDWYLVTNWYDWEGNYVGQTHEYVGTTCPGSCGDPMNQTLCPDYEDPGNDDFYEFARARYHTWTVANSVTSAQLYVGSTELIKGKVLAGSPNGGYFTHISHNNDFCSGCNANNVNGVWVPSNISVNYSQNAASSSIQGNLWYQGVSYPVGNNISWLFYEVF